MDHHDICYDQWRSFLEAKPCHGPPCLTTFSHIPAII
jgi:hypothetical protein